MARVRSERSRSKTSAIDDLAQGIEQLQAFIPKLEDLGREGFPYLEGALTRTELQLRECIKRAFGDKSPEFQTHRHLKLALSSPSEKKQTLALLRTLIGSLEDKKLELQGLKPAAAHDPAAPPASPTLTLVPPASSTVQVSMTVANPPVTATTLPSAAGIEKPVVQPAPTRPADPPAGTTTAAATEATATPPPPPASSSPPRTPIEPISSLFRTQETKPLAPTTEHAAPPVNPSPTAAAPAPSSHASAAPEPPAPALAASAPESFAAASPAPSSAASRSERSEPPLAFSSTQEVPKAVPSSLPPTPPHVPAPTANAATGESDHLAVTKTLCQRFHMVARQLRLRGEYRPTVNVEDEGDVQDLMHALLRQHFDDITTDEWTPSYTNGVARTTLLLDHDRLAIVLKKTRTGLTRKDLADQVRADVERYRDRGRCNHILCFIYDPEGRIGNPRGLESELSSTSEHFAVDVVVAPK
ncbi:MAG TPA: hypothetical protein VFM24_08260 [Nitrospira sp.]|nr:hypothetical protein [Nitrospira sp.]